MRLRLLRKRQRTLGWEGGAAAQPTSLHRATAPGPGPRSWACPAPTPHRAPAHLHATPAPASPPFDPSSCPAHPPHPPHHLSNLPTPPPLTPQDDRWRKWVGCDVEVLGRGAGTLRFYGMTHFKRSAPLAGVELDEPVGLNDGSRDGKRYFTAAPNRGVFVPPDKVRPVVTHTVTHTHTHYIQTHNITLTPVLMSITTHNLTRQQPPHPHKLTMLDEEGYRLEPVVKGGRETLERLSNAKQRQKIAIEVHSKLSTPRSTEEGGHTAETDEWDQSSFARKRPVPISERAIHSDWVGKYQRLPGDTAFDSKRTLREKEKAKDKGRSSGRASPSPSPSSATPASSLDLRFGSTQNHYGWEGGGSLFQGALLTQAMVVCVLVIAVCVAQLGGAVCPLKVLSRHKHAQAR